MDQQSNRPRTYRYKGHTIEPLHSRVCSPEGWLSWLVCPAYNPEASWYARSLGDARESINAAVQESIEAAELEDLEAEGRAALAGVMANSLIRRHAQRLGLTPEELSAALLRYAVHQLADWTDEGDANTIVGEKNDPGSVWYVGDAPFWLEPHMPAEWLERHHEEAF